MQSVKGVEGHRITCGATAPLWQQLKECSTEVNMPQLVALSNRANSGLKSGLARSQALCLLKHYACLT
eukprot:1147432-Pelagomonas_calceolata.AAC.1